VREGDKTGRWAQQVERIEKRRGARGVSVGKPERDNLEDPAVDGTILIRICRKWNEGMDWINLAQNSV